MPARDNSHSYWQGNKKDTIDMEIEVFGSYNMKEDAKELYNISSCWIRE
jgi:hypothetical protein